MPATKEPKKLTKLDAAKAAFKKLNSEERREFSYWLPYGFIFWRDVWRERVLDNRHTEAHGCFVDYSASKDKQQEGRKEFKAFMEWLEYSKVLDDVAAAAFRKAKGVKFHGCVSEAFPDAKKLIEMWRSSL